jgi:hypothetical protein
MCKYRLVTYQHRSCKQMKGSLWSNGEPHIITHKYIHLCESTTHDYSNGEECCAEEYQTEEEQVDGDRGHTWLAGDCPACKAAEEAALEAAVKASFEVYHVSYILLPYVASFCPNHEDRCAHTRSET